MSTASVGSLDLVRDAWQQRRVVPYYGRRFNEKRYLRTKLGRFWLLLRPGFTVGWQLFVFLLVAPVPQPGGVPFGIALLAGLSTWAYFSEAAFWATRSLELNRRSLRAVRVAPLAILIGAFAPALIDLAICLGFFVVALVVQLAIDGTWHLATGPQTLLLVPGFALLTLLASGIGLALAVPGARYRDVRFGLRFALSVWYFVTPVFYPVSAVPDAARVLVELNPASAPIAMVQSALLDMPGPSTLSVAASVVTTAALLVFGLARFRRGRPGVLDHV